MTRRKRSHEQAGRDAAHAEGHRHLGPPPGEPQPAVIETSKVPANQPWVPRSGLVGRIRRSPRRG